MGTNSPTTSKSKSLSLAKTIKNWWKGSSDGANEEAGPASPPNRGMSTPPGSPPKQPGEAATSGRLRNRVSFSAASNNPPTPDIKTKEYSDLIHQYENDFLVAADKLAPKTKIGNKNQQHLLMMTNDINLINAFIEYKSNSENQKDSNYKKFNYQSLQDVLAAPSIEPLKKEGNYSWDIAKILNLFNWDPTRRNRTNYYDEMKAMVKNEKNNTVSDVLEKIARIKDAVVMDATSGEPAAGTSSVNVGNLALGRNNPAHAAPPVVLVGSLQSSADPQPSSLSGGFPHSEIRRSPFDHPNDASSSQIRHDAPFKGGSNPGNIPDSDSNLGRSASLESALFTEHSGGSLPDMDKTVAHWNLGESSRSAPAGDASISRGSNRGGLGREPSSDNVASAPRSFAAELADSAARFDAAQQKWTAAAAATAAAADDQLVADAPRAAHAPVVVDTTAHVPVVVDAAAHAPVVVDAAAHAPVVVDAAAHAPVVVDAAAHAPVVVDTAAHAPVVVDATAHVPLPATDPTLTVESVQGNLKSCQQSIQGHLRATPDQSASVTTALTHLIAELQARINEVNNLQPLPEPPSKSDRAVRDLQLMMLRTSAGLAAENFRRIKVGYSPQDSLPSVSEKISVSNLENGVLYSLPTIKLTSNIDKSTLINEGKLGNIKHNELFEDVESAIEQSQIAKDAILEERTSSVQLYDGVKLAFKKISREMDLLNGNGDIKTYLNSTKKYLLFSRGDPSLYLAVLRIKKLNADMNEMKLEVNNYNIPVGNINEDLESIINNNKEIKKKVKEFEILYRELEGEVRGVYTEFHDLLN